MKLSRNQREAVELILWLAATGILAFLFIELFEVLKRWGD